MVNVGLDLDDDVAAGLYHLRDKRKVDLSAWVQGLIRLGLLAELQDPDLAPALVGWTLLKLDDESWGAVHDAPQLLAGGPGGPADRHQRQGPRRSSLDGEGVGGARTDGRPCRRPRHETSQGQVHRRVSGRIECVRVVARSIANLDGRS